MTVRLTDIARKLKVSHTTVSRALNPKKQHMISAEMREKIFRMVQELQYSRRRPVAMAKRSIGVLLPTMINSIFFNEQMAKLLTGIFDVLRIHREYMCKLLVLSRENGLSDLTRADLTDDMEGLLISSHTDHSVSGVHYYPIKLLQLWDRPVVALNLEIGRSKNINVVAFSNFDAARKAVTHLIRMKRRRIAMIYADLTHEDSKDRYDGYTHTLKAHYIRVDKSLIKKGDYSHQSGYAATRELCADQSAMPNGIFCTNDEMAIGAIRALRSLRIRRPEDVDVIGFYGLSLGEVVQPRLSTVTQPLEEIAKEGTKMLINLIEGKIKKTQTKLVPSQLIIRESA